MKILMVNKFLHPNGGSETYIFKLGDYLKERGHKVQYFGMEHEGRIVGNDVNAYTTNMDFHNASKLTKLTYPLKTIYSTEARKKIRLVLNDFQPDVVHLNNFNYQLTPSIILEIQKWKKQMNKKCKVVFTAHDSQLLCPNHLMKNPITHENCTKCLDGKFYNCVKGKCVHGSTLKSIVGMLEAYFWKWKKVYKNIDVIICCSDFMKRKMDLNPFFSDKTLVMHNFVDGKKENDIEKQDYVLYFGRYSTEKGIHTLIEACKELTEIPFVFAGTGPLEEAVDDVSNIKNVGFQTGVFLENIIRAAQFSIHPSECYENCPFSVMESQMYGTPVLGAEIGGIPELVEVGKTGELFPSGDKEYLKARISEWWNDKDKLKRLSSNCKDVSFDTIEDYYEKLIKIYKSESE